VGAQATVHRRAGACLGHDARHLGRRALAGDRR